MYNKTTQCDTNQPEINPHQQANNFTPTAEAETQGNPHQLFEPNDKNEDFSQSWQLGKISDSALISQAEYIRKIREFLPQEAFVPDPGKLLIYFINIAILILGWGVASTLHQWNPVYLWLYLPLTVIMGNSITALLFSSHEIFHGSVVRNYWLIRILGFFGLTMLWMPPTQWKAIHNRVHHSQTNSLDDPDRNHFQSDKNTLHKLVWQTSVPSVETHPITLIVTLGTSWSIHAIRNLTSVLLHNEKSDKPDVIAPFTVSAKERRAIFIESFFILSIHLGILAYLQFNWLQILLGYLLPTLIGHGGAMFYIFTNHMICPMTSINDPLINSVSLKMPKIFDLLHFNFSYHAEHHIFPGMNSDYYPQVREVLQKHYPDRMNYILDATKAWGLLLSTPRLYKDEVTLTDSSGTMSVPCPIFDSSKSEKFKMEQDVV